jgi:hypothetical protein
MDRHKLEPVHKVGVWFIMFEIKACEVSEKRSPVGYRDEFFGNKRNAEIGHYGQTLIRTFLIVPNHPYIYSNSGKWK